MPGEGLFGVRLVVSNGGGFGGTAPQSGDAPDWWIEVDQTKPAVELVSVRPSMDESNVMVISWRASDKNFGTDPIDLYFSTSPSGPWTQIAKGLPNDGKHRWLVPQGTGIQAYFRVVATDRVGNVARCESSQPVTLDDGSRPHAHVQGVVTPALRPAPTGN